MRSGGIDQLDKQIARLKIPGYRLLGKCGAGGMGRVYKANQISLQRDVAIKILEPTVISAGGFRELFRAEIEILSNFRHPNVVTIFDAGEAGGLPYFVMEYIAGVTLRRLMAANDLTPLQVVAICGKICEGLAAAHGDRVVHRDLKPENVMVSRHGVIKIMDFGVAAFLNRAISDSKTSGGNFSGTRLYASPEQLNGGMVDGRSDIYALGVMTYEMLTLSLPGKDCPPPSKVNPDCPQWLDHIVAKMMADSPADRYGSAEDLLKSLRRRQDAAARAAIEDEVAVKAMQFTGASNDTIPGGQSGNFLSRLLGFAAFAAFTTSLFLPYVSGTASNLEWDRWLQDARYTKVPITSVVVALACLSLTTCCLRNRAGRSVAQILLAWMASAAMGIVLQQMRNAQGQDWRTIIAGLGHGSQCYLGGAVTLLLGGLVSIRGADKAVGLLVYLILMALFIFRNKLLPG